MARTDKDGIRSFTADASYKGVDSIKRPYNTTDIQAQDFQLYIEGIQVPYISISVSQVHGELPSAVIQIPPESSLLDITRGYQPKVHVFYRDLSIGAWRLLFWGLIMSCSYGVDRQAGSSYVQFNCIHKNHLVRSVLMDYAGWVQSDNTEIKDSEGAVRMGQFNSMETVVESLRGLTGIASAEQEITPKTTKEALLNTDVSKAPSSLVMVYDRLIGVPGITVNMWNQIKRFAYANKAMNVNISSMMAPLVEEGLSFFKRMSGHRYLEFALDSAREDYCHERSPEKQIIIPPALQSPMLSAVKGEMAANAVRMSIEHSGEYLDYLSLIQQVLNAMAYDMITLASPADVATSPLAKDALGDGSVEGKSRVAVETIIKPQIPFYYSPTCNVVLPRMYTDVQLTQEEGMLPTRLLAYHSVDATEGNFLLFRGPHSIREATAYGFLLENNQPIDKPNLDLKSTFNVTYNVPGIFEQGVGIRPAKIALPWWLATMANGNLSQGAAAEAKPDPNSPAYISALKLAAAWDDRYSKDIQQAPTPGADKRPINVYKQKLNPYNLQNPTCDAFQSLLISAIDYEFAKSTAMARTGTVNGIFNPYIIPGYPMELINDSPNHPCFHALCTSVTHSITGSSVSTSIGMAAVTSYAELSNFYTPPVHPSLQVTLKVVDATVPDGTTDYSTAKVTDTKSTILQNPTAKAVADEFYRSVLGVGAAAPEDLYNFEAGRVNGVSRANGILVSTGVAGAEQKSSAKAENGGELNDYLSSVGNLRLIHRRIETITLIKTKFKLNFIALNAANYNEANYQYVPPIAASGQLLEPGASMYLQYLETNSFITLCKAKDLT